MYIVRTCIERVFFGDYNGNMNIPQIFHEIDEYSKDILKC